MNLPNLLTFARFIFTGFFIYGYALPFSFRLRLIAVGCLAIAAISDFFDGYFARKWNQITAFGKIADPIADKFLVLAAFIILSLKGWVWWWLLVPIAIREVGLTILRLIALKTGKVLAAEQGGKIKTTLQMVTIFVALMIDLLIESRMININYQEVFATVIHGLMILVAYSTLKSGFDFLRNNKYV